MILPFPVTIVSRPDSLALILAFLAFFLLALLRLWRGYQPGLRPIPAWDLLSKAIAHAAETGRPLHVSPGTAGLGDNLTAETVAGLTVLETVAGRCATSGAPMLVSTASPLVLPIAQGMLRQAWEAAGYPQEYRPEQVRFIAQDRNAYAIGAADLVSHEGVNTSVLLGHFAEEYLLLGEPSARARVEQVAGTGQAYTLPFMITTANEVVLGEEIFAAGAYLTDRIAHIASLVAQDNMRLVVIIIILAGVLLQTVRLG